MVPFQAKAPWWLPDAFPTRQGPGLQLQWGQPFGLHSHAQPGKQRLYWGVWVVWEDAQLRRLPIANQRGHGDADSEKEVQCRASKFQRSDRKQRALSLLSHKYTKAPTRPTQLRLRRELKWRRGVQTAKKSSLQQGEKFKNSSPVINYDLWVLTSQKINT